MHPQQGQPKSWAGLLQLGLKAASPACQKSYPRWIIDYHRGASTEYTRWTKALLRSALAWEKKMWDKLNLMRRCPAEGSIKDTAAGELTWTFVCPLTHRYSCLYAIFPPVLNIDLYTLHYPHYLPCHCHTAALLSLQFFHSLPLFDLDSLLFTRDPNKQMPEDKNTLAR